MKGTFSIFLVLATLCLGCFGEPHHHQHDEKCTSPPKEPSLQETNKKLVLDFFQTLFVDKNVDGVDKFIDAEPEKFLDHNPNLRDGREPIKAAFREMQKKPWHAELYQAAADGDRVWIHFRVESQAMTEANPGHPKAFSIVDIFRVKEGKIVELWDVTEPIQGEKMA